MDEAFWRFFVDLKIAEEYYLLYVQRSKRFVRWINIGALLGSAVGVISFFGTWFHPITSSVIVLLSQIISIVQPFYPFGERVYAGTCIYKDLSQLALTAEQLLNQYLFGDLSESTLFASLSQIQDNFAEIETRFAQPDLFPRSKRLHKKAQANVESYLKSHFNTGG